MEWIIRQEGVRFVIHYLDDFLLMRGPTSSECSRALTTLLSVFDRLGLPVALEKLEGPWCQITFLGFELDSSSFVIRLPTGKLRELQHLIGTWVRVEGLH